MSVEVDICNSALIKLGAEPINDLTDDTKEARLCRLQYPKIRDSVLRSAPWGFAVRRALLAPVVSPMAFEDGENVFQQPADCVRVWKAVGYQVRYKVEGRKLISSEDELRIKYITNTAPVDEYDANFKEAVANMLAADLCYAIVQSTALKQGLEASGSYWIDQARSHNSQEGSPDDFQFDDFLDARFTGDAIFNNAD